MRRLTLILILAASGLAVACDTQAKQEERLIDAAKVAVAQQLNDPGSAQYRDVRVNQPRDPANSAVCGLMNARNAMGGYGNFVRFIYIPSSETAYLEPVGPAPSEAAREIFGSLADDGRATFDAQWSRHCI